jgi:hypothetical protein
MFGRRSKVSPSNETVQTIPVFARDPRGAAMAAGILDGTLGHLGSRVVIDARGDSWHGWTAAPQGRMTGAANLGAARPKVNPVTRLDQERGVAVDSIQAAFQARSSGGFSS